MMTANEPSETAGVAGPKRKLAAILHADVAGYSRLMGQDETGTHAHLIADRRLVEACIAQHGGRVVGTAGDAVLADFPSVIEALSASVDMQAAIAAQNATLPAEQQLLFRIGINIGDVIVDGDDIFGDGVNVAARVENLAEPGGIAVSGAVYEQVKNKLDLAFRPLGEHRVKNIEEPIQIYAIGPPGDSTVAPKRRTRPRRRVVFACTLVALLAAITAFWLIEPFGWTVQRADSGATDAAAASTPAHLGRPTIAVLPFENQSDDPDQDYFSAGVSADVIASLGRFSSLQVLSWNAVASYAGQTIAPEKLGQDLGVRYVVGGTIQRAGDLLRVNVQLTDAEQGVLLWSERYDGGVDDVFSVQDEITRHVVGALAVQVTRLELDRIADRPTEDMNAYDKVLRGRDFLRRIERSANLAARVQFEQARTLDPGYADALVGLGETYLYDFLYGWTEWPQRAIERAAELAEQALELEEQHAQAHALLAYTLIYRQLPDRAEVEIGRALELNPNDSQSLAIQGVIMSWAGKLELAVISLEQAMRLDPSPISWWLTNLGEAYYLLERYEDAIRLLDPYRRQFNEDPSPYVVLAASYAQLGREADAAETVATLRRLSPFFTAQNYVTGFVEPEHRDHMLEGLHRAGLQ